MDGLYHYLSRNKNQQFVTQIQRLLENEEYDTDALEIDILFYEKYGQRNMQKLISNQSNL